MAQPQTSPAGPQRMKGQTTTIVGSFFIVTLPLLAFNVILIAIIARYAEPGSAARLRELQAIYVDINATTLTAFTSWSSTLAPLLGSFMVVLASYPACKRMVDDVRRGALDSLPTPYQLAMLLQMRAGVKWRSLGQLLQYKASSRGNRTALAPPVVVVFTIMILGIILGFLVFATDTWFHLATSSEIIFRYSPSPGTNMSFALRPDCLVSNNSHVEQGSPPAPHKPCTINIKRGGANLWNPVPINSLDLLSNVSRVASVKEAVVGGRRYTYLGPGDTDDNLRQDYSATTYALSTKCASFLRFCTEAALGVGTNITCDANGIKDYPIIKDIQMTFYRSTTMGVDEQSGPWGVENPFSFFATAILQQDWPIPANFTGMTSLLQTIDSVVVINCTTTAFDVSYQVRNGTVARFDATASNVSATNALQSAVGEVKTGDFALIRGWSFAGFNTSTVQDMLDNWAPEFDRTALALGATGLRPGPALASQYRDPALVTRVPLAPLVCLLLANLAFTVVGVVLAAAAWVAGRDRETHEAVERASVVGLVAAHLEARARLGVQKTEDMFAELDSGGGGGGGGSGAPLQRVGIVPSMEGGYTYQAWVTAPRQ